MLGIFKILSCKKLTAAADAAVKIMSDKTQVSRHIIELNDDHSILVENMWETMKTTSLLIKEAPYSLIRHQANKFLWIQDSLEECREIVNLTCVYIHNCLQLFEAPSCANKESYCDIIQAISKFEADYDNRVLLCFHVDFLMSKNR